MPPQSKKKKVAWNNNDCRADVCLRPEGTASWVQCDECGGWYHVACLFLEEGELLEDKEFYCPNCNPDKEEEFNLVREKLTQMVEELSGRQTEFGGVTIDRDMFKEKKNANPYNYAKEFPPTLRDLGSRVKNKHKTIGDFKWDYKLMCGRLTEELKDDYESRIQMVEWELDEIAEEILKEEEKAEEEPEHIEIDLDMVKREKLEPGDIQECGAICEHCAVKFSSTAIYSCKREHRVCHSCRTANPGCVCPVCYSKYGDRKRLALDHTSALLFRVANATNFDVAKMGKRKRRPGPKSKTKNVDPMDPMIMNVWSCTEENTNTMSIDQINIEGPIVKAEPDYDYEEPEQVSMSTVLSENCLSNQLLTLIDNNIVATQDPDIAEVNQSPHTSPLSQQPTNYNDTGDPLSYNSAIQPKLEPVEHEEQLEGLEQVEVENFALSEQEITDHINSIREPMRVTSVERQIMEKREEIQRLVLARKRGENVGNMIQQKREEIIQLRQEEEQELLQGGTVVIDPFQALDYLEEEQNQTPVNLGEVQESPWRKQASSSSGPAAKVSPSSMASSWAKYRARAQTSNKLPVTRFQSETGRRVHTLQVTADGAVQIAPVQAGQGSVQPHPLPSPVQPSTVSYHTASTNTVQYQSVGTVTIKQYSTSTPVKYHQPVDSTVQYQPSDTDQYQVESTVQFPPSLEVNHQPKGSSVQYQKVGDNVYRKVSPVKLQSAPHVSPGPSQPVQYTGPSQPVQYTGPSQPVQYTGPSQPVQLTGPSEPVQLVQGQGQVQYITPEPSQQQYYNPADSQAVEYLSQTQYTTPQPVQHGQYVSPVPSQSQYYNPAETQSVKYLSPAQSQPVPIIYSKTDRVSPLGSQKASPIKSPTKTKPAPAQYRMTKVSPVKTMPLGPAPPQYQTKPSQPTYTIQYTKPNPFSDPLLISPLKKQTSSTALSSPAPSQPARKVQVQKPLQVQLQKPTLVQIQDHMPVPTHVPHQVQVQKPTLTQYHPVTIKYNQPAPQSTPGPTQFQPQPITGATTKQIPQFQPQPITGPSTKQFLTSSAGQPDPSTTPLAITIKYNQPGPAVPGSITPQTITRSMLISPPKAPAPAVTIPSIDQARKVLEARGCSCETLTPRAREHVFTGPLQVSLMKNYQGTDLEWRPFLALYAATGPEMYQFQLGRSGHIFYIRGVTSYRANMGDRWHVQLNSSDPLQDTPVEVQGVFSMLNEGGQPPSVLPSDIVQGDVRHYIITVSQ